MEHRSLAPDLVVSDDNDACGNQRAGEPAPNVAPEELRQEKQVGGQVNCSDSELCTFLLALLTHHANRCNIFAWIRKRAVNAGKQSLLTISISQKELQNHGVKIALGSTKKNSTKKSRIGLLNEQETTEKGMPKNMLPIGKKIDIKHICMSYRISTDSEKRMRNVFLQKMEFIVLYAALLSTKKTKEISTIVTRQGRLEISCAGDATLF